MRRIFLWVLMASTFVLCGTWTPGYGQPSLSKPDSVKSIGETRLAQNAETDRAAAKSLAVLEPPRLSYVSPGVRTQTRHGEWQEALPDQAVEGTTRIATGKAGPAEITIGNDIHIKMDPATVLLVKKLRPGGRGSSKLRLYSGSIWIQIADTEKIGAVTVSTPNGKIKLRAGTARISSDGLSPTRLAIYKGQAALRVAGTKAIVQQGQGALLTVDLQTGLLVTYALPTAPSWPDLDIADAPQRPLLAVAIDEPNFPPKSVELRLDFTAVSGAAGYLVEIARDKRFYDHRLAAEVTAPPFRVQLPPGLHHVRVTPFDSHHIFGPTTSVRTVYLVPLLTDAKLADSSTSAGPKAAKRLQREQNATLRAIGGGLPLKMTLPGGREQNCQDDCLLSLGPGEHRVTLALRDAKTEVSLSVQPAAKAETPATAAYWAEPVAVPTPLLSPGFPGRTLDPRTRLYSLLSIASTDASSVANVYRLDLGGEMTLPRRVSIDLNLPLLYYSNFLSATGAARNGLALGDISLGSRWVALEAFSGRLRFGPLLRLQAPTGSYDHGPNPERPMVIDPAVGLAGNIGRVALLTTQGLPISLNLPTTQLRWSMNYAAEVKVWKLSLGAALDAAIGLHGAVPSGAALGGGLRLPLGEREQWRLLFGMRGGLGASGQALFGLYTMTLGIEWLHL